MVEDNLTDCLKITIDSVTGVDIKTTSRIPTQPINKQGFIYKKKDYRSELAILKQ